jgi:hypothetical protein
VSFFDAQPVRDEPPEPDYRPPEWSQPPDNVMPASVALDALIVSHDNVAAWVAAALVYPSGLLFELVLVRRERPAAGSLHRPWFMGLDDVDGPRFAIGFADGRRATVGRPGRREGRPEIVLSPQGGGGSDRRWTGRMWLWPLPTPGVMTFAFAWAEQEVEETTVDVDTAPLLAAADRAGELWADDRPDSPG